MKDAFKIKKGLNIAPVDPVSVVNPEAGDLIIDSSDDNKLKVFDEASSDWASVGSGGSSGNLMSDFEKLTPTVSNVVASTDTVTYLPIDDNNKSVKAVFSGSNGSIRYEVAAPADLEGTQGVVQLWIKTSVQNLQVIATRNGVQYAGPLTVNSSNKWRQYEIPVVFSDADYGFEIKANGSAAGDVFIDEAFVKVDSSMFQRNVSGAQYVGSIEWQATTGCTWATNSNTFSNFPNNTNCDDNARILAGSISDSSAGLRPEVSFNAKAGHSYQVIATGEFFKSGTGSYWCEYAISDGSTQYNRQIIYHDPTTNRFATPNLQADVRANSSGNLTLNIVARSNTGTTGHNCNTQANFSKLKISVFEFPDSTSTIVTQSTELTAQTANELSARISSSGTISSVNYDWIQSVSKGGTGVYNVTFKSNLFSKLPAISLELNQAANFFEGRLSNFTTSGFTVEWVNSFSALADVNFTINASKQGSDVNKHATIVGKFENINSSELVKVEASGNGGTGVTDSVTNITWSNETMDNYNAWNGTTFTAPKDSWYIFSGGIVYNSTVAQAPMMYINTVSSHRCGQLNSGLTQQAAFTCLVKLSKNDVASIRNTAGTLLNSTNHKLYITELPDTESIIKNLNDANAELLVHQITNQTLSSDNAFSDVVFPFVKSISNIDYNTTTGVATLQKGGVYTISTCVTFSTGGYVSGSTFRAAINKNGSDYRVVDNTPNVSSSQIPSVCGSISDRFNTGDQLKIRVFKNFGGSSGTVGSEFATYMTIIKVGS